MFKKRRLYIFILIGLVSCGTVIGQGIKHITANFENLPFDSLVKAVEQRTPYRFYYDSAEGLDTVMVTLHSPGLAITELLKLVLQNTSYHFIIDALDRIYITRQIAIQPDLPEDFFNYKKTPNDIVRDVRKPIQGPETIKASVENKLFEIGDRTSSSKGKVTLSGYVRDTRNGEPIPGASVYIDSLSANVTTDQFGYYSLTLPSGKYVMQVNSGGMKSTKRHVHLYGNGQLNIDLVEYIPSLKEVVVVSARNSFTRSIKMGVDKLSIKSIKQVPVVFG